MPQEPIAGGTASQIAAGLRPATVNRRLEALRIDDRLDGATLGVLDDVVDLLVREESEVGGRLVAGVGNRCLKHSRGGRVDRRDVAG